MDFSFDLNKGMHIYYPTHAGMQEPIKPRDSLKKLILKSRQYKSFFKNYF